MAQIPASLIRLFAPIAPLLRDPTVRTVFVDGPDRVFVRREGASMRVALSYTAPALNHSIQGLAAQAGKAFDEANPWLEVMLPDGTRFLALRSPVVARGPVLSLNRATDEVGTLSGWVMAGRISEARAALVGAAVRAGLNVGVVGAGRSTRQGALEALASSLPTQARMAVVDNGGVPLGMPEHMPMRLRPHGVGADAVTGGDLLYCAGQLDLDRVVVSTARMAEAWDVTHLLAERAVPVLLGLPGVTSGDALGRLAALAEAGAPDGRGRAAQALVGAGLDLVVVLAAHPDRVVSVEQVSLRAGEIHTTVLSGEVAKALYARWAAESALAWPEDGGSSPPARARPASTTDNFQALDGETLGAAQRALLQRSATRSNRMPDEHDEPTEVLHMDDVYEVTEAEQPFKAKKTFSQIIRALDLPKPRGHES